MKLLYFLVVAIVLSSRAIAQNNVFPMPSGNVGIGTTSPAEKLHIEGAVNGELNLLIKNTYTNGARTYLSSDVGTSMIQTDMDFAIQTNGGGWSKKFVVKSNGNIGIGTTTPSQKLHVEGSEYISEHLYIGSTHNAVGYGKTIDFGNNGNTDGIWLGRYNAAGDATEMRINIGDDGGSGDKFVIGYTSWQDGSYNAVVTTRADGNVGIGTTSPSEKLSVNGNILTRKVKVTQTGWADYVFHPTYQLPSLTEVEDYIKEHQHLKDIPSAKEVEEKGLDLGDNQAALLKKIEELTLYMIEMKKENEGMKKELSLQNSRIKRQENQIKTLQKQK